MLNPENRDMGTGGEAEVPTIKCMIVGNSHVGKTDLFLTLTTGSPATTYSPTVFDTFTKGVYTSTGVKYNLGLWDSSGDSLFDEIRPICYPHTDCFILCYAIDDPESFKNIEFKWKPEILRFGDGPQVPLILVGLKSDLRVKESGSDNIDSNNVTFEQGQELKIRLGAVGFFECSTINTLGIHELLREVVKSAVFKKSEEEKPPNPIWGFEDLKILVVGDTNVGKSAILSAYTSRKPMKKSHQPTTEVVPHFQDVVLDGIEFFLGIYDMPSAPQFLNDRIKEYHKASGIILVYAVNDPFSFQNVESYWVPELRKYCPTTPTILVGNKSDVERETGVLIPMVDGEELTTSIGASAFIQTSAKSLQNIQEIFTSAAQAFRRNKDNKDTPCDTTSS